MLLIYYFIQYIIWEHYQWLKRYTALLWNSDTWSVTSVDSHTSEKRTRVHGCQSKALARAAVCLSIALPQTHPSGLCNSLLAMAFSNLSLRLLDLFSKGELSATKVQALAHAAWQDGWGSNELDLKLAHAGSDGAHTGNLNRDVIRAAEAAKLMQGTVAPYKVALPQGHTAEMFLPHEMLPTLIGAKGGCLEDWVLPPDEHIAASGLPVVLKEWLSHPDVQLTHLSLSEVIAMGLHCDGVAYLSNMRAGSGKSILVASINVISASSPQLRNCRRLLFVLSKDRLCKCGCQGYHTTQALFSVFAWSMSCLARGRTPATRHDGAPWTAFDLKHRVQSGSPLVHAGLVQVRGDWEWLFECFRLRSWNSEHFCWMCNATKAG